MITLSEGRVARHEKMWSHLFEGIDRMRDPAELAEDYGRALGTILVANGVVQEGDEAAMRHTAGELADAQPPILEWLRPYFVDAAAMVAVTSDDAAMANFMANDLAPEQAPVDPSVSEYLTRKPFSGAIA